MYFYNWKRSQIESAWIGLSWIDCKYTLITFVVFSYSFCLSWGHFPCFPISCYWCNPLNLFLVNLHWIFCIPKQATSCNYMGLCIIIWNFFYSLSFNIFLFYVFEFSVPMFLKFQSANSKSHTSNLSSLDSFHKRGLWK